MFRYDEGLGRAVFEDQRGAYNRRGILDYECLYCEARPGNSCDQSVFHGDNYRLRSLSIAAERHRAHIEAMSELFERSIRGASWLFSRLVLDLVTQGGNNEH